MDEESFWVILRDILTTELFRITDKPISLLTIMTVITVVVLTLFLSRIARKAIRRGFRMRGVADEGTVGVVTRLVHFAFLLVGIGVAVEAAGLDLTALFAAGAVFAVALGFAVQNIVQNFVAGVILLLERVIKPGDVLWVDGELVRVREMGIRATVVRTLNDEDIIVPNGNLVGSAVKNYTFSDHVFRLKVQVGVTYDSDMKLVMETLEEVGRQIDFKLEDHEPIVLMTEFGDSSVNFELSLWVDDPWAMRRYRSKINQAIWWAFKEKGIVIAFPQVDVHFDKPVATGLANLKGAA
jgi:small-conductance mechanosensitive channel